MTAPKYTQEIFETLSKGHFICANSPDKQQLRLYDACENATDNLREYFAPLGFNLEMGLGYFYFSKELNEQQTETKLENIMVLLDLVHLMLQFDENFSVNYRTSPIALAAHARDNIVIRTMIEKLKGFSSKDISKACDDIFKRLEKDGFIALEDEYERRYVVLSAYNYLKDFFNAIQELS